MPKSKEQKRREAAWRVNRSALPGLASSLRSEEQHYQHQRDAFMASCVQRAKEKFLAALNNVGPIPLGEVVADAAASSTGRIEMPSDGIAADAISLAARCGFLNVLGTGAVSITYEGHEFLRRFHARGDSNAAAV